MKKRIISALSVLLMLCVLTMTVSAVEVPDMERTGSISITMTYEGEPVPGGSLTLYRVAEVSVENGADYSYSYVESYQDCDISLENLSSAQTAQDLAAYTEEKGIAGTTQAIDKEGVVVFEDLELGLYLLVQEEAGEGYSLVSPFLVSVPGRDNSGYLYHVDASPKLDLEPLPTEPTKPTESEPTVPETTRPSIPQTGQTNWPIPMMVVLGVTLVVLGWYFYITGRKKSHES